MSTQVTHLNDDFEEVTESPHREDGSYETTSATFVYDPRTGPITEDEGESTE